MPRNPNYQTRDMLLARIAELEAAQAAAQGDQPSGQPSDQPSSSADPPTLPSSQPAQQAQPLSDPVVAAIMAKLDDLSEKVNATQPAAAPPVVEDPNLKRARGPEGYVWQHEGTKKRHRQGLDVLDQLQEAKTAFPSNFDTAGIPPAAAARIHEAVCAGVDLVVEQALDCLLADSYDWKTVELFRGSALVGEDEQKKLKKASSEAAAAKEKARKIKQLKNHPRPRPYTASARIPVYQPLHLQGAPAPRRQPGPNDICNGCGQRGHWQRDCPEQQRRLQRPGQ